ncbi:MAG TPA: NYN domain-containing protein, partial [Dehalococcoidales bacterium]|nr:NYN domain-containing protein [Dehalococcoidales bacterium]
TAILVSGDADFAYAVQAVKNMGKHVEVAYFENGISKDLLDIADHRYLMDRNFFTSVWVIKQRPLRRKRPMGKPYPYPKFKPAPNASHPDINHENPT